MNRVLSICTLLICVACEQARDPVTATSPPRESADRESLSSAVETQPGEPALSELERFAKCFESETTDSWGASRETLLTAKFKDYEPATLVSAVCKTTICKIDMGFTTVQDTARARTHLIMTGIHLGAVTMATTTDEKAKTATIYVTKDGYDVPGNDGKATPLPAGAGAKHDEPRK